MEIYPTNVHPTNFNKETIENQRDFEEDDVFYEELRRQVLLLTAEDDEEFQENKARKPAKSSQQRWLNTSPSARVLQKECYYNWSGNEATESVPKWIFNLWRTANGTGVFIPQVVHSRRRNKPRRKNNERGKMYKQAEAVEA